MDDKKRIENFAVGYLIGQKIKKVLETGLALGIVTCMWGGVLWLFSILGIGHSWGDKMNSDKKFGISILGLLMLPVVPLLIVYIILSIGYLIYPCPC